MAKKKTIKRPVNKKTRVGTGVSPVRAERKVAKSATPAIPAKPAKKSKTLLERALFQGKKVKFFPVILAGGSGTRFWPHSRRATPKQVLALDGAKTMIQQTVERLAPLAPIDQSWVISNDLVAPIVRKQLPKLNKKQVIAEPAARNTAPAIGLAAFILARKNPDAVIGLFPADHVIKFGDKFREDVARGIELAASGEKIVVMGVLPQRPETGYGYIETGAALLPNLMRVKRFTEKPNVDKAREFIAEGNYYWNSGMFLWSARTLVNALHAHLPETAKILEQIAATYGGSKFDATFKKLYPKCQNISIDYAVLEPRSARGEMASGIFCIATDFGWNDLGSWSALHDHRAAAMGMDANVIEADGVYTDNAAMNFISAPKRFVAAIGVRNLIVVETDDALLITTRQHAQDVGKVPKYLGEKGLKKLI